MTTTYIMDITKLNDDAVFEGYFAGMPVERQNKILRIKYRMDKNRSLGAGILLARGLLDCGINVKEADIREGEHGKPYLAGHSGKSEGKPRQEIHFNLSHAGDYVAAAFGPSPVGIDIEHERENTEKIVRRCFRREEQEAMESCQSKEEWADLFLRYWTIKESAAKVSGLGMQIPFTDIRHTEDCRIEVKWKDNIWKYFLQEIEIPDKDDIISSDMISTEGASAARCSSMYGKRVHGGMDVKVRSHTGKDKYRIAVCAETAEFAQEHIWVE